MEVTFDTGNGIETNDVGAVQLNDDEYIPLEEALEYAELERLYITDRTPRTYLPGEWYDGISRVELNVDYNTGTKEITENGVYKCQNLDAWDTVEINCSGGEYELTTERLTVSHNGIYKPTADGFYSVDTEFIDSYYWYRREFEEFIEDADARYVYYDGYLNKLSGTSRLILDGDEWVDGGELPYDFRKGVAIVIKGVLHIMGTSVIGQGQNHYSFDGTEWKKESNLPSFMHDFAALYVNGWLYLIGGKSSYSANVGAYERKAWRGVLEDNIRWKVLPELPANVTTSFAVEFNNNIYCFSGKKMYRLATSSWKEFDSPITAQAVFVADDGFDVKIHLLGDEAHWVYDGDWYVEDWFADELTGTYETVVASGFSTGVYVINTEAFRLMLSQEYSE